MPVEVAAESDVQEGQAKCVSAGGRPLALYKVDGQVYCLDGRCTHLGGPLCEGDLDKFVVQCPWHGSRFDVRTGQVVGPPARKPVRFYPVRIDGGKIWVDLP